MKVSVDQFADAVSDMLMQYGDEVREIVYEEVEKTATEAVKQLKATSPRKAKGKRAGRYARGWRKKNEGTRTQARFVIYNATDGQLTHLLENGHAKRNGGRVAAIPHIAPVEETVCDELYDNIVERIVK